MALTGYLIEHDQVRSSSRKGRVSLHIRYYSPARSEGPGVTWVKPLPG
jgi:hypothetical protein